MCFCKYALFLIFFFLFLFSFDLSIFYYILFLIRWVCIFFCFFIICFVLMKRLNQIWFVVVIQIHTLRSIFLINILINYIIIIFIFFFILVYILEFNIWNFITVIFISKFMGNNHINLTFWFLKFFMNNIILFIIFRVINIFSCYKRLLIWICNKIFDIFTNFYVWWGAWKNYLFLFKWLNMK